MLGRYAYEEDGLASGCFMCCVVNLRGGAGSGDEAGYVAI
jgi:hypothetical protein